MHTRTRKGGEWDERHRTTLGHRTITTKARRRVNRDSAERTSQRPSERGGCCGPQNPCRHFRLLLGRKGGTFLGYGRCHNDREAPRTGLVQTGPQEWDRPPPAAGHDDSSPPPQRQHPGTKHGPSGAMRVPLARLSQGTRVTPWRPCPSPCPPVSPRGSALGVGSSQVREPGVNCLQCASLPLCADGDLAVVHSRTEWVLHPTAGTKAVPGAPGELHWGPHAPRAGRARKPQPPGCSSLLSQSSKSD